MIGCLAIVLMSAAIAVRIVLWVKFRHSVHGRRIGISTLQLLLVVAAVAAYPLLPLTSATAEIV
jgi:hypothetical protein